MQTIQVQKPESINKTKLEAIEAIKSPQYERHPNRCLNEQRLQKLERCERHGRNGNIACQFCSISMYYPEKGFTCEA
jgi:hypothetical protein